MRITIKLYATLTDYLPPEARNNRAEVEVAAGCTVLDALTPLNLPPKLTHLVLVNGAYIPPEARATTALAEGDTLAVWPPIAGG